MMYSKPKLKPIELQIDYQLTVVVLRRVIQKGH